MGQFKGEEKKLKVVLEAIADGELWIWANDIGTTGRLHDIKILDASTIVEDITSDRMLPYFSYDVNNHSRRELTKT